MNNKVFTVGEGIILDS